MKARPQSTKSAFSSRSSIKTTLSSKQSSTILSHKPEPSEEKERSRDFALLQAQILAYYRTRIDAFDQDRVAFYSKLDQIRLKSDLVHKAEWELKKRIEEKSELQRALE